MGLGQFVIPPLAEILMEKWGLVRTFLVLSAVTGSGLGNSKGQVIIVREVSLSVFGLVYSVPNTNIHTEKKTDGNLSTILKDPQMICFLISCFLDCLGSYSVFAYTSVMTPQY